MMVFQIDQPVIDAAVEVAHALATGDLLNNDHRVRLLHDSFAGLRAGRLDVANVAGVLVVWVHHHRAVGLPLPGRAELRNWAAGIPGRLAMFDVLHREDHL